MTEKKEPRTTADHVSGLKREPLDTGIGGYFFPLIPAAFFAVIVGLGSTMLYIITVLLARLFWMEGLAEYLFDQDRMNMLSLVLCRYLVIQSVVVVISGVIMTKIERRREAMS